ncbi:glutamate synthase large subunit, partial [Luminiphilus sp.]|nr:glutamate synthase large subunit [Luminiphilus sp.]
MTPNDIAGVASVSTDLQGLYRPEEFRDNCGFGLIAHIKGQPSHRLLETAIESLTCMTHRGGIAADGKTGDGCGLLLQMPDSFMRAEAQAHFAKDLGRHYAVGMIFMGAEAAAQSTAKAALESALAANELDVIGWREVPLNPEVCGEIALDQLPHIEQVFIDAEKLDHAQVTAKLFMARRQAEIAMADDSDFYICSLSDQVLSYK